MHITFEPETIRPLVLAILAEADAAFGWPSGRVALTEKEAAAACGVKPHVLRDIRLDGRIKATKLGRGWLYTRRDLLAFFSGRSDG